MPGMDQELKEQLIGWLAVLLFGIALIVWPPLGTCIHETYHVPLDYVLSLF
jgi:hypothetical protein